MKQRLHSKNMAGPGKEFDILHVLQDEDDVFRMPRQRHIRRHSVVAYGTGEKPPKPGVGRDGRPDITSSPSHPARPCGLSAMKMPLCVVGVVPARVLPVDGAYLRVSGPSGSLTRVVARISVNNAENTIFLYIAYGIFPQTF